MNTKHKVITGDLEKDIDYFKNIFKNDDTFEFRVFESRDESIKCCIAYINPMINKQFISENLILPIMNVNSINLDEKNNLINVLTNKILNVNEIEKSSHLEKIIEEILQGNTVMFFQGIEEVLIVDTKEVKTRGIDEPDGESVIRGSKEGFNECIEVNIGLIRRKILSKDLKFKYKEVGKITKTKICICYLENVVSKSILKEVYKRLENIKLDGVLESSYIEEVIKDHPESPFTTVGSTERPDVVAAKLLEGRIAIICNGTPFVLTVPFLFIENFQNPEDYYNNFIYGSFIRIIRILGFCISTTISAVYLALLTYHQEMLPTQLLLSIAASKENVPLPTMVELILMLFIFEILKEASARLPRSIGQTVSIIGALVLGDASVKASIVSPSMVIIVAITGITSYLVSKMSIAMLIVRSIFILSASLLGLYGCIFIFIAITFYLTSMKSFGVDYMSMFMKINKESLFDTTIRCPWWITQNKHKFNVKRFIDKK